MRTFIRPAQPSEVDDAPVAPRLMALADRLERLTVSRRDPAKFFEDRSELAYELRQLARRQA